MSCLSSLPAYPRPRLDSAPIVLVHGDPVSGGGSIDRIALKSGLRLRHSERSSSGEVTPMSALRWEREYNRDDRWGVFHVKRASTHASAGSSASSPCLRRIRDEGLR